MQINIKFFEDRIGKSFHYMNYWMDKYAWNIRRKIFFRNINVSAKKIIDFGAGDGSWGKEFLKRSGTVVGVEQSKKLADNCKIPCLTYYEFLEKDSSPLPVGWDMITCFTSLNFTKPKERLKILKKFNYYLYGFGEVVVVEYLPDRVPDYQKRLNYKNVWTRTQWKKAFEKSGFKLKKEIPINFVDTTIFHYFGGNFFTYLITYFLDLFTPIIPFAKYRLQIYTKIT